MVTSVIKFQKPVPTQLTTQKVIRPELNLEKMAQIWQPARSREKQDKIVIERPNSAKVEMTANSKYGPPTTETQKILYALYQISEEQEHPRGFFFSRQKIARILKKSWGESPKKIIDIGLYQLRLTGFVLEDAFYDASKKKTISFIDTLTILSQLKLIKEKIDGHTTKEACYCEFNEYIHNNLVNGHVKPLLFETVLSLGDDGISQIFYTHLDLMLSSGELTLGVYQRRSKELFQEFNFFGKEYAKVNYRKKILEKIQAKLTGKPLSKGGVLTITIEKTKDRQDYLLIAKSVQSPSNAKAQPTPPKRPPRPEPTEPNPQALELVRYFHQRFFNLAEVTPRPRELTQAARLIQTHGVDLCRQVVDFAYAEAQQTKFKVATFGGLNQYVDRAVADHDQRQAHQDQAAAQEAELWRQQRLEADYDAYCTVEFNRYVAATCPPEQYAALVAAAKEELRDTIPVAATWSDDALTQTAQSKVDRTLFRQTPILSFADFCRHPSDTDNRD